MTKVVTKNKIEFYNKILYKIIFKKVFFKTKNQIIFNFNYKFLELNETGNTFVGVLYKLQNETKTKKIKKDGKKIKQYFKNKDTIIFYDIIKENKFIKLYYVNVKNEKTIYHFVKNEGNETTDDEFEI